jgi:hypothetical protein
MPPTISVNIRSFSASARALSIVFSYRFYNSPTGIHVCGWIAIHGTYPAANISPLSEKIAGE